MKVPATIDPAAMQAFHDAMEDREAWIRSLPKGRNPDLGEFTDLPADQRFACIESHPWCLCICMGTYATPFAFVAHNGKDANGKSMVNFTLSFKDAPACLCAEDVRKLLPWATERATKGTHFKVALWHRDAFSEFIKRTREARNLIPIPLED